MRFWENCQRVRRGTRGGGLEPRSRHIAAGTMIRGTGAAPVLFFEKIWCNMVARAITGGISL